MKIPQATSRTTGPIIGMFVLIVMHLPCSFISSIFDKISELFENLLKNYFSTPLNSHMKEDNLPSSSGYHGIDLLIIFLLMID